MLIPGYKGYKKPTTSKGYDTENEKFTKYGKEILIKDYVEAGRDGTEAKELIAKAGGIDIMRQQLKNIPESDIEIDMNIDPFQAKQLWKMGQIAEKKIKEKMAIQKEMEKLKSEIKEKVEPQQDIKGGE